VARYVLLDGLGSGVGGVAGGRVLVRSELDPFMKGEVWLQLLEGGTGCEKVMWGEISEWKVGLVRFLGFICIRDFIFWFYEDIFFVCKKFRCCMFFCVFYFSLCMLDYDF